MQRVVGEFSFKESMSKNLKQLFRWNKKVLLFTIFSGVEAELFES